VLGVAAVPAAGAAQAQRAVGVVGVAVTAHAGLLEGLDGFWKGPSGCTIDGAAKLL